MNGLSPETYRPIIQAALLEDIGYGDITSNAFIAPDAQACCQIVAREAVCLSGSDIAAETFTFHDATLQVECHADDGAMLEGGDEVLTVSGNARAILAAERTALNMLSYLSGIATYTHHCVQRVAGTGVTLLDTRKTLPLYRDLAKYAVRCGGGHNHRMRLDDGVMVKDNHIAIAGGIKAALTQARRLVPALTKIEIECDTLEQVREAVSAGVDMIMLDNMDVSQVMEAVEYVAGRVPLEVSGGMTLETIEAYAKAGVTYISLGSLTHSVKAVDFGLDYQDVTAPLRATHSAG